MKIPTILSCGMLIASVAQAQQPEILHQFGAEGGPIAPLVKGPDGNFYGTTPSRSTLGLGSVFRIAPDGTYTTIYRFNVEGGGAPWVVGLQVDNDGNLYGTTDSGGTGGRGTVFQLTPDGVLTTLVNFNNANGSFPRGLMLDADGTLYGTTVSSSSGGGTVFRIAGDGTFTTLANFPNNYGSFPAGLISGGDGTLYGRTYNGSNGAGTIFRVGTDGALTTLATLSGSPHPYTTALVLGPDGNFYGTTFNDGVYGRGTLFRMTPGGIFTTLHHFSGSDGSLPAGPLVIGNDGDLYGTTMYGGVFEGTVFRVNTVNPVLTTLAHFTSRSTGARPYGGVTFGSDGDLYGTTITGGTGDNGIIFRLQLLTDSDGDGVLDDQDLCPGTAAGTAVNRDGCSIEQLVPCDGPTWGGTWKSHGAYVSAVAHAARMFVRQGIINKRTAQAIVMAAAKSDCGKKARIRTR